MDAVVKIYCTHTEPNYSLPWQRKRQYSSTSSGFVVAGDGGQRYLLTNAHSVEYYSQVGAGGCWAPGRRWWWRAAGERGCGGSRCASALCCDAALCLRASAFLPPCCFWLPGTDPRPHCFDL